jgi:hypothetical protein
MESVWNCPQMDLPKTTELQALIAALAPGMVILGIRERFVAAPPPSVQERAISYAAVSAVYFAVAAPLVALAESRLGLVPWAGLALENIVVPALIGTLAAFNAVHDWSTTLWGKFGIHPVHPAPTAWDYAFSRLPAGTFVLVTLGDGSKIAGLYARASFASSSSGERDLLIEDVWEVRTEQWTRPKPQRSVLLCGRDIQSIELLKEEEDERQEATA